MDYKIGTVSEFDGTAKTLQQTLFADDKRIKDLNARPTSLSITAKVVRRSQLAAPPHRNGHFAVVAAPKRFASSLQLTALREKLRGRAGTVLTIRPA